LQHPWVRGVGMIGRNTQQGDSPVKAAEEQPPVGSPSSEIKKRKSSENDANSQDDNNDFTGSDVSHRTSPIKKEKSDDNEAPMPGDITGNLPSIRKFTALRKFHRGLNVVSAAVKFKGAGIMRERRRSESLGSSSSDSDHGGPDVESQNQSVRRASADLRPVSEDSDGPTYLKGFVSEALLKTIDGNTDTTAMSDVESEVESGSDKPLEGGVNTSLTRYFDEDEELDGPPVVNMLNELS
jgi:hypothetical protein